MCPEEKELYRIVIGNGSLPLWKRTTFYYSETGEVYLAAGLFNGGEQLAIASRNKGLESIIRIVSGMPSLYMPSGWFVECWPDSEQMIQDIVDGVLLMVMIAMYETGYHRIVE